MPRFWPLFTFFLYWTSRVWAQSPVQVVDSEHNLTYIGYSALGTEQFQGIRYGQDTSGPNRFKHPLPFTPAAGSIIIATREGPACPQNTASAFLGLSNVNPGITNMSEDCLNLRIARPVGSKSGAKLPVMVWIYGGGDETGSTNVTLYDPTLLVIGAAQKGTPVVFVSMNYRLNVFGFAASSALATEKSLNSGLLDQRLALQWIHDNIAVFGGDPENVTLFGQSDGATSAGLHMTAYGGEGNVTFQRAIMESGSPTGDPGVSGNTTAVSTSTVASLAGCSGSDVDVVACLRNLSMAALLKAVIQFEAIEANRTSQDIFFPTVDNDYIPAAPSELLLQGRFHKGISIIAGWTFNDGTLFTSPRINSPESVIGFIQASYPYLRNHTIHKLLRLYPVQDFAPDPLGEVSTYYFQAAQIYRDINFACPALYVANEVARWSNVSTYLYDFNTTIFRGLLAAANASFEGVIHISEVPFVFNDAAQFAAVLGGNFTTADNQTQIRTSGSWAQFATNGNPSGDAETLQGWNTSTSTPVPSGSKHRYSKHTNFRVIGGPNDGLHQLSHRGPDCVEPMLLRRCALINSPWFYRQTQT